MRTNRPDAGAAIADAAFPRICGKFFAAVRLASWKRPFKAAISVDFGPTVRRVMFDLTHRGQFGGSYASRERPVYITGQRASSCSNNLPVGPRILLPTGFVKDGCIGFCFSVTKTEITGKRPTLRNIKRGGNTVRVENRYPTQPKPILSARAASQSV